MKIVEKLLVKLKPVEIIKRSSFFDEKWYQDKYGIENNQAEHYLNEGWKNSYNPSDRFSSKDYLINNPDIRDINPLLHYEAFGKYEGRKPFVPPLEDINDYVSEDVSLDYEKLFEQMKDKNIISFDVFDTLIDRPFSDPKDLFRVMEHQYNVDGFYDKRIEAEANARKNLNKEVNLDDIYLYMDNDLKEKEIELEIKLCHCNKLIKPLYDEARRMNKRVIAVSDMYHSKQTIEKMLSHAGYQMDEVYVSCEYNMTKGNGNLYQKVLELESAQIDDMIHFGDNYLSDYSQARLLGISSYQTPKSLDYCLNRSENKLFLTYLKRHDDLSSSIYLQMMAEYLNFTGDNYFKRLGYMFAGPLSLAYLYFICNDAVSNSIDELLFVSRDGYSLIEVYKKYLYEKYKLDYAYAYLSRAAIFSGHIDNHLCKDLKKFLAIAKLAIPDIVVHEDEKENMSEYEKHKEMIDSFSIERSNNLRNHLDEISKNHSSLATVDMVSGNFTSLKGACYYLTDRLKKGYFAGSFASQRDDSKFFCCRLLGMRDNLPVKLSELLISSPESPIIGLNSEAEPIYEYCEDPERVNRYQQIMEGVFEYCDDYIGLFELDNTYLLDFKQWLDLTAAYLNECSDSDIEALAHIVDSENPVSSSLDKSFKQLIEEYRLNGY